MWRRHAALAWNGTARVRVSGKQPPSYAAQLPTPIRPIRATRWFFNNIINEFAKADWSAHQLELAAILAKTMADYIRESALLREEGAITVGGMGGNVPNPRKQVVQMHAANIVSFRRTLALHAAAQGQKADVGRKRAMAKEIEGESPFDD